MLSLFLILGSLNRGVFDGSDLVLDHRAHGVEVETLVMDLLLGLIRDGLGVDDGLGWLRVFSGISDNGRVGLDGSGIHWDLSGLLLLLLDLFGSSLLNWLGGGLLTLLGSLSIGLLLRVLLDLSGSLGRSLLSFLSILWLFGLISLHILSEGLDKVISELLLDSDCIRSGNECSQTHGGDYSVPHWRLIIILNESGHHIITPFQ